MGAGAIATSVQKAERLSGAGERGGRNEGGIGEKKRGEPKHVGKIIEPIPLFGLIWQRNSSNLGLEFGIP